MNWLSYFIPQTIVRTASKYNRDIRVVVINGKKKLLVNGIQQSGPTIEGFWKFAFSHLELPSATWVKTILVLGVGGGTVIHKLHALYPKASIIGVDIDEKIITIGQEQFGLSKIEKLKLIVQDALAHVRTNREKYDFVIVDLYIGRNIPDFESSVAFVHDLHARVDSGGSVLFNFLHDGEFEKRSENLRKLLMREFDHVYLIDLPYNRFFLAR